MLKLLSLIDPAIAGHPNSNLGLERDWIRSSKVAYCRLWARWPQVETAAHQTLGDAWAAIGGAPGSTNWVYWRRLDDMIAGAHEDGMKVLLSMSSEFPAAYNTQNRNTWLNGRTIQGTLDTVTRIQQRWQPDDLTADSPWAHFLAYLCCRYRNGAGVNPDGPQANGNNWGNSRGTYADYVQPLNEPNYTMRPGQRSSCATAQLINSAEAVATTFGGMPLILPDMHDKNVAGELRDINNNVIDSGSELPTGWLTNVLSLLGGGWTPRVYVGWSYHPYGDFKYGPTYPNVAHAQDIVDTLRTRAPFMAERTLWATEGGYAMSQAPPGTVDQTTNGNNPPAKIEDVKQESLVSGWHSRMPATPEIATAPNHIINNIDGDTGDKSGLSDFTWLNNGTILRRYREYENFKNRQAHGFDFAGWDFGAIPLGSRPSACSWQASRMDLFFKSSSGADVCHQSNLGGGWSAPETLGGDTIGAPTAASWGRDRVDIFVRGWDYQLWHRWWDGGSWNTWEPYGGYLSSGPSAITWCPQHLDIFVLGGSQDLWHRYYLSGNWSAWTSLGTPGRPLVGDPVAVSWGYGRVDVFCVRDDGVLAHIACSGSQWGAWELLGGGYLPSPGATTWGPGFIDVFLLRSGDSRRLYKKSYRTQVGWTETEIPSMPANQGMSFPDGPPSALSPQHGRIELFGRRNDTALAHSSTPSVR